MYKNRKRFISAGLIMILLAGLTACSTEKNTLSDVGTNLVEERDKSEYLDIGILSEEKEIKYSTYTVQYGDYEEEIKLLANSMYRQWYFNYPIRVSTGGETVRVAEIVSTYVFANQGEALAVIERDIDPVAVLEAQLKLQRLQERYEKAKAEYETQREEKVKANALISDAYMKKADSILLERDALEWEHTARQYEAEILNARKALNEVEQKTQFETIYAPKSGYYNFVDWTSNSNLEVAVGTELQDGEVLCFYQPWEEVWFASENSQSQIKYGSKLTCQIGTDHEVTSSMASAPLADLYGNLGRELAYFKIDLDINEALSVWGPTKASIIVNEMEHVLLVPAAAVTEEKGIPYVTVVKPDGTFRKTGFVAGGHNSDYYWVLSGLEEGTEILLGE